MAASLAAQLEGHPDASVKKVPGRFGEFSVFVDEQKVVDTNRFWYPNPGKVRRLVEARLDEHRRRENSATDP